MNKNLENAKDNIFFKKLLKLINLLSQLSDCGINDYIKFPRICFIGGISSGKSSVLESILGFDFIPRGDGIVTRRPLEIRLCHTNYGEPWAFFEEIQGKKFTDFEKINETIEKITDEVCRGYRFANDKPIILYIYSQICPDLTLVDLPGIRYIPVGYVPKNIELLPKNIASRYIEDPLTIIICIIAANSDIFTSEGLRLAKEIDTTGERTLGVLTKLDIMDAGTDARKTILNEEVPLKLGYVAVMNRSKRDLINNKLSKNEFLKKEKEFFKSHPAYKYLPSSYLGNDALINKLSKLYFKTIKEDLKRILKLLNDKIKKTEKELHNFENPVSQYNNNGKMNLIWKMIKEYCDRFRDILQGKYNNKKLNILDGEGGYKIKILYKKLLEEFTGDYKATSEYSDEDINYAFIIHEGNSMPGFPSIDAFIYLLRPQFEKLKEPIEEFFTNIFQYIEFLSEKILEKTFAKFPNIINDINSLIMDYLIKERDKTKFLIDRIVDMEINYLFTNDNEYLNNFNIFSQKNQNPLIYNNKSNNNKVSNNNSNNNLLNNEIREYPQINDKNIFIKEIRNRIDGYFKLVIRNLRENIPKIVGNFLVKEIRENMEIKLYNKLYNFNEISDLFVETENNVGKKKELNDMINIMKNLQKEIRRDRDIMALINDINIS